MIKDSWILGIVIAGIFAGTWFGYAIAARAYRNNAIQHECGGYDYKTGEFKWGQGQ
jgi:hypothetical protein